MTKKTQTIRLEVVEKVRRLRQTNRWTQARLGRLLGLSQNRLSEIERGSGSFTAEQLLLILKTFNTPLSYFSFGPTAPAGKVLQNAISRLGASPLQESPDILPTEKLDNSTAVIREVLTDATTPRQITALAPVIVNQPNSLGLNKLRLDFFGEGRINRLGWLFENTLLAVRAELHSPPHTLPKECVDRYHRTEVLLQNILRYPGFTVRRRNKNLEDPLEPEVLYSNEAFEEAIKSRDRVAKRWRVVTRIKTGDFVQALRGARENN
ncbi:MAG: helix-turn-helix transcriptional regulator [Elusimicrobia bacterium]|nr:helix-turn-helix transcriptional regulator [Elusimicrobiota bacterium]